MGEGEWAAVQHGGRGHRGWKTLHLAVDRVGVIVAHALTEPTVDAATIGIDLIDPDFRFGCGTVSPGPVAAP